jgi:F0F1-type ATP synthase delta subunit
MKSPRSIIAPVISHMSQTITKDDLSYSVAAYLLNENRVGELDSLMRDVIALRAERGIVEITAVSAHSLSTDIKMEIEQLIRTQFKEVKLIIINERIDPDIVGGVRLELVDRQLDLSIRTKLNHFKELTLTERTI